MLFAPFDSQFLNIIKGRKSDEVVNKNLLRLQTFGMSCPVIQICFPRTTLHYKDYLAE